MKALTGLLLLCGAVFTMTLIARKGPKGSPWTPILAMLVPLAIGMLFVVVSVSVPPGLTQSGGHVMTTPVGIGIAPVGLLLAIALIVGLVVLLIKAPKAAAALIGVLVVLFVLLFYARTSSQQTATVVQQIPPPRPVPPVLWQVQDAARAPIWSDAMEEEFKADVYSSKAAAARALGSRMAEPIAGIVADPNRPIRLMLALHPAHPEVMREFKRGIEQKSPNMRCSVETGNRPLEPNEVGVLFRITTSPQTNDPFQGDSGEIVVDASLKSKQTSDSAQYVEKAWVWNFGNFASNRPNEHYVIARSEETSTSESEARTQAMEDARRKLNQTVGSRPTIPGRPPVEVTARDVQEGGFIADTFVQSFDGSAGNIWRQAMLIDVSAPKLAWLTDRTVQTAQTQRLTWFRQIGSAVGVLVLILVTYFFLNMATRGYYEWSLRIAGIVLGVIAIVVFLA